MADKKISQLPVGNLTSETIFPIVTAGITSQTSFGDMQDAIGGGNSYVRGWKDEQEQGNSINIGKGIGKITLTNGSDAIVAIDGANFDGNDIGSIGYDTYQFTVVLLDGTRRYISFNYNDSTNGIITYIYLDNQSNNAEEGSTWTNPTGDYDYYPYFIPEATGGYSYAEGYGSTASGYISHAEGYDSTAVGQASHAEGSNTIANGYTSHAEGYNTQSIGQYSHAEGYSTQANGDASHAEGYQTTASGNYGSHAEGVNTIASGRYGSHAEGQNTTASGSYGSHAGGSNTIASGLTSFVHGLDSVANGNYSIVLGRGLTGTTADTTYVDRLSLKTFGNYANDAAADADSLLPSGGLYTLTGSRAVYRKP